MKKIKAELKELRSKTEEQQNYQTQNRVKISNNDNEIVIPPLYLDIFQRGMFEIVLES